METHVVSPHSWAIKKICPICKTGKPLSEYYITYQDKPQYECKTCAKIRVHTRQRQRNLKKLGIELSDKEVQKMPAMLYRRLNAGWLEKDGQWFKPCPKCRKLKSLATEYYTLARGTPCYCMACMRERARVNR